MAILKGLLKRKKYSDGIYPYTQVDCVFDKSGKTLDSILNDLNTLVSNLSSTKQNNLSAGRGISINNNTISNQFENLISNNVTIASGDRLIFSDTSNSNGVARSSITFGSSTELFLTNAGTWKNTKSLYGLWYYSGNYSQGQIFDNQTINISSISDYSWIMICFYDSYSTSYLSTAIIPNFLYETYRIDFNGQWRTIELTSSSIVFKSASSTSRMLVKRIVGIK